MKCPKCQHENEQGDKFCRECGERLPSVCPQCGNLVKPGDRFCAKCGTRLAESVSAEATVPRLEDMHSQLQSLIPEELAQKYATAEPQAAGENRPVTALFADISGFTPLSSTQSSETMLQLVQECFRELVGIVARYEGIISGFRGDGLLALFGAPILHENDAERAIRAAMDMRNIMHDRQLEVTIGINTAPMTVGEIQTQLHREYTAYGTDVILASRLQDAAEPGQILAGTGTHRLTRRIFDFGVVHDLELQGFPQPVTAYTVQQVKVHPEKLRGIEGLRARMIGREHEFAELKESADEWLDGQGQMVCIIGEAGIGKSRLVGELRDLLTETQSIFDFRFPILDSKSKIENQKSKILILEGRCVSIGQPISYWPFLDILRTWFGFSEEDTEAERAQKLRSRVEELLPNRLDDMLPFLGHLMNLGFGGEIDTRLKHYSTEQISHGTMMRLRELLVAMSEQQRLLLILEDLHWSDDLSLDLVSLLMDELMEHPLMLLCVYRPERKHRVWQLSSQAQRKCLERYTEVPLQKLRDAESRRLVQELLTIEDLPGSVRDMILRKSEGNPFFIEEVIRSLIERGLVYHEDDRWKAREDIMELEVPDTIQSVILARVDRLEAEAKYVLQCASVIGRLFKHRLLEHLTQKQRELDRYISEFEDRDLVYEERTIPELEYAFKHALTQEATYQGILEQRRRVFHRIVAQGIERLYQERIGDFYEELAYHWERGGDDEKTLEYLMKAGEKAAGNYLNEAGIDYYTRALQLAKDMCISGDRLGGIYDRRGSLYGSMTFYEESVSDMNQAADLYTDRIKRARMYSGISNTFQFQIIDANEAVRYAHRAMEEVDPEDKSREASLIYEAVGPIFIGDFKDLKEGERLLRKAVSISEEMGYKELLALQYTLIGWMYWFLPRTDDSAKQRLLAQEKARSYMPYGKSDLSRYATVCGLLSGGSGGKWRGYGESLALEAVETGIKSGNAWITVAMATCLGFLYRNRGEIDKAVEVWEKGWRDGVRVRYVAWRSMIFANELMRLYTLRDEKQKLLHMMLQMVDSTEILHSKPEVHPTVQIHWNGIVEGIYRTLRSLNPGVFRMLEESLRSRLSEAGSDDESFFYQGQLAWMHLLDKRRADALKHLDEMARLYPNAGRFPHRLPKDMESAVILMKTPQDERQMTAKGLLATLETIGDLSKTLDGINLVLTQDEFAQAADWDQVDRFALEQLQSVDFAVAPWFGDSIVNVWLEVQEIYKRYDRNERMKELAKRVHETMSDILEKQGISQLLPEPVESMKEMRVELSEDFGLDPSTTDWEWVDPMEDCCYRVEAGEYLEIEVPPDHNLWYRTNCDAPRLLRRISGDFMVETMISDGSNGAKAGGLLVWSDEDNLIRLEVTYVLCYRAFLDQSDIASCIYPLEADSCRLRLERQGNRFTAYASWEREEWYRCGWIDMALEDPIQIGIYGVCPSAPTTSTRFEYFKIYRASGQAKIKDE